MKRKAKPLRMWAIKRPEGTLCTQYLGETRLAAKGMFCSGGENLSVSKVEWDRWREYGYRAVRVTVREEV